jgi:hypothetical protein
MEGQRTEVYRMKDGEEVSRGGRRVLSLNYLDFTSDEGVMCAMW